MRMFLICILSITLLLTIVSSAYAAQSAEIFVQEAFYWPGVIQEGDMVIISRYDTEGIDGKQKLNTDGVTVTSCKDASDWDNCAVSDIWIRLIYTPSGDVIRERTTRRLGHGLIAFYLSPDEVTVFSNKSSLKIEYVPSPLTFDDISNRQSISVLSNSSPIADEVIRMLQRLQEKFPSVEGMDNTYNFHSGQLVENGSIVNFGNVRPTGWDILVSAHPVLPSMILSAFQISSEKLDEQFGAAYLSYLRESALSGSTDLKVTSIGEFSVGQKVRVGGVRADGEIYSEYVTITAINDSLSLISIDPALTESFSTNDAAFVVLAINIEVDTPDVFNLEDASKGLGVSADMLGGLIWTIIGIFLAVTTWQMAKQSTLVVIWIPMAILIGHSLGHVPTTWLIAVTTISVFIIMMMIARSLTRTS